MRTDPRVVRLDGKGATTEAVGGKAASLARMIRAGLPVPLTAVVTTPAYREFTADPTIVELISRIEQGRDVDADDVETAFTAVEIEPGLAAAITDMAASLAEGGTLAVRSSATVEDLAASSFAGQYRTFLGVDPDDAAAVLRSIRLVWASLWDPAPVAYRRALGIDAGDAAMAVVIMPMVPAERAGVVFTRDPTGSADQARVEAVRGLGEALVSGAETPTAWVLRRGGDTGEDVPKEVGEALRLSLEVERMAGGPQDVEWSWDGDRVWLVQSRPITSPESRGDGFDSPLDDHELTTAGISEMVPGVLPPLRWQLNRHLLEEAFRRLLDDLDADRGSGDERRPLIRRVRGRAALDFHQLRQVAEGLPGGAVEELEAQYFGIGPSRSASTKRHAIEGAFRDLRMISAKRRAIEDSAVVVASVDQMRDRWLALAGRDERDLLAYRERLIDLAARAASAELTVAAWAAASYRRVEKLIERHLGPDVSVHQAQLVTSGGGLAADHTADSSAAVFGGPTWRELGRLPPVTRPDEGRRRAACGDLELRLTSQPGWRSTRVLTGQLIDLRVHLLRRAIKDAIELLELREQTKAAFMTIGGEVRRVHFEIGRRLRAGGNLDAAEDVELLTEQELRGAVAGHPPGRSELELRRICQRRYDGMGPLPLRFVGSPDTGAIPLPDGDRRHGWAASPGRFTGRVRVVTGPHEAIEPGEVLVAEATDASWSPLFTRAGAIVVERGGPLSHAAILARELGIPAVLNLAGATRDLAGRIVTVDGDVGTVVVSTGSDEANAEAVGAEVPA